jgi:A118 family predicted phage portal protein
VEIEEADRMNIVDKLSSLGYTTIDGAWYDRIRDWNSWYKGNVEKFHNYSVWTGQHKVKCQRYSLGMGKKVCEDWADLLMNEKVKITLEGTREQEYIDGIFTENDFEVNTNELMERGAARGTYAIIPHASGVNVRENDGTVTGWDGRVVLDYITGDSIFPLAWSGNKITQCAFCTALTQGEDKFVYMQLHVIESGVYVVYNRMFRANNDTLQDADLAEVQGYENVPPKIATGSDTPQFVIGRYAIANNIEDNNPMGIAVFANAVDVLKGVDVAYDSYVNEFVLGKKRVMVKPSATKHLDGEDVFDPNDVTFYVLPEDVTDGAIIQPIDMALRTAEHTQGLQQQLDLLSSKCGFGQKHYQFDQGSVATATQIVSENSDMFRTIKKHEIILESVLIDLCRILLRMGNRYGGMGLNEDIEISVDFDDSIIEDKTADRENDRRDLEAGIMNPYEYRMKWYNEDEATAKAALPKMQDMVTETQNEVE